MEVKALTPDRRIISVDLHMLLEIAPWYVEAADGVWVPRCDHAAYDAGGRTERTENDYTIIFQLWELSGTLGPRETFQVRRGTTTREVAAMARAWAKSQPGPRWDRLGYTHDSIDNEWYEVVQ